MGAYIRKYKDGKSTKKETCLLMIALLLSVFIHSGIDLFYAKKYQIFHEYGEHVYTFHDYANILTMVTGVSLFMLTKRVDFSNKTIRKAIQFVASLSFLLYLGLMIGDKFVAFVVMKTKITLGMNMGSYLVWTLSEFMAIFVMAAIYYEVSKIGKKARSKMIERMIHRGIKEAQILLAGSYLFLSKTNYFDKI